MDFWKTQTAMHHSPETWDKKRGKSWRGAERESGFGGRWRETYRGQSGNEGRMRVRGPSRAPRGENGKNETARGREKYQCL